MRESLVEMARIGAEGARQEGREAMHQHGAHKLQSRQERLQLALDLAVEKYAHAKELFAAWQSQRAESIAEVDAYIHDSSGQRRRSLSFYVSRSKCACSAAA